MVGILKERLFLGSVVPSRKRKILISRTSAYNANLHIQVRPLGEICDDMRSIITQWRQFNQERNIMGLSFGSVMLLSFAPITTGPVIIFSQSKNNRDSVLDITKAFDRLQSEANYSDLTLRQYHADNSIEEKDNVLNDWLQECTNIDVIVTTKGFALGLDKSNVRMICSYRLPADALELVQAVRYPREA